MKKGTKKYNKYCALKALECLEELIEYIEPDKKGWVHEYIDIQDYLLDIIKDDDEMMPEEGK